MIASRIAARGRRALCLACVLLLTLLLSGCMFIPLALGPRSPETWPPAHWDPRDYGSFSPDRTTSYDGAYYALQTLEKLDVANNFSCIRVTVYDAETDAVVDSFLTERAWDFWGICWEPASYNIWIQSADVGTYCMRYDDGAWVRDDDYSYQMPEEMIDRYRMRNGSFAFIYAVSSDGAYAAIKNSEFDSSSDQWIASVSICSTDDGRPLFTYLLEQGAAYKGLCWDHDGNVWIRLGDDELICLRRSDDGWVRDDTCVRPDYIALEYDWDGTIKR